ncbi:MAG: ParB N-terminal domain-containing protein [Chloroflexi bacterium]|jgi:hypothetical protein|nr:ParB N-terminal domain-containing protein [Chloroflexota bacterium]
MTEKLIVDLSALQPSQLYISADRLRDILTWLENEDLSTLQPLPVKILNNRMVLTDGHHRALAMHLFGLSQVAVEMDEDELDWEAYEVCVAWCLDEGISSVKHLENRIVNEADFHLLWDIRCDNLHADLEKQRCASG